MLFKLDKKFSLNTFERKLKKFKREPDQFFKDMVINKKEQVQKTVNKIRPIKNITQNKFTIVSAVYNVGKYLDDYFESIINQSVSFKDSIYIICVDDGSTDNSADIIQKWQKKYPKNIKYIYKENGGQSSARNLGLDYVKTDWVLFTDPDDYLESKYFEKVDSEIKLNNRLKMVVSNIVFYFEDKDIFRDNHPLKYRFNTKKRTYNLKDLADNMNLSVASTVFNFKDIKNKKIKFNADVKPNFEDGKFIADFMLNIDGDAHFAKEAIYYYRKRSDTSSTLDTAWSKPEKFYNVLKYGHLDMLMSYQKKLGYVPYHIQRTALYDMYWYVVYLLNKDGKVSFLDNKQKADFLELMRLIFSYIDVKTILSFKLGGIWFKQKVGLLGFFKNTKTNFQISYIENIDRSKNQVLVTFFSTLDVNYSFKINGKDTIPAYFKKSQSTFVGKNFVTEYRAWISFEDFNDNLEIYIDNDKASISIFGVQYDTPLKFEKIFQSFSYSVKYDSDNSWIFIDRDTQADDNAEHLYRFIMNSNLKEDCFFALTKDSKDWERLSREGFKLIEFGSSDFESKLRKCSKIISSNIDHYIDNYFGDDYEYSKKIVFLQHGIIKDDLSNWLNTKKNMQCFLTSTLAEYTSIVSDDSSYKSSKKEVVLTGLPRHDYLFKNKDVEGDCIILMPTWRNSLIGKPIGNTNVREYNEDFIYSDFFINWKKLLHSEQLKNLSIKYNAKIIFAPHVNLVPYIFDFNVPKNYEIWSKKNSNESIQSLFLKSRVLITDYSSVAFDVAYLEKPIVYFQFDKDTIFSGNHTYQKGYFEYERDGFGPVVEEVEEVEQALEQILQNDGQPLSEYLSRMQDTFKFKDGRCCERVYNAILALDHEDDFFDLGLAQQFLQQAYDVQDFPLVKERANNLLMREQLTEVQKVSIKHLLAEAYFNLQNFEALESLLNDTHIEFYQLKLLAYQNKWADMLELLGCDAVIDQNMDVRMSMFFNLKDFNNELAQYDALIHAQDDIPFEQYLLAQCYIHYVKQEWTLVRESIAEFKAYITENSIKVETYTQDDLTYMHMMADKYLNQIDINLLLKSKSHTLDFEIQKALTLSEYSKAKEACVLFKKIESENGLDAFDHDALHAYITSLFQLKDWKHLKDLLDFALNAQLDSPEFTEYYIEMLFNLKQYAGVVEFVQSNNFDAPQTQRHMVVLAHYRLGLIDEAYKLLIEPSIEFDYSYWVLALEIYMQTGHEQQVIDCVRRMYAIFPDKLKETKEKYDNLSKLLDLI